MEVQLAVPGVQLAGAMGQGVLIDGDRVLEAPWAGLMGLEALQIVDTIFVVQVSEEYLHTALQVVGEIGDMI